MSHGDVVLVGSRFWEVERPRACAGGGLRCAGGGLGVCVEVFFSFEWVRCVDRGWREVHPGPSRWCGMARGGGGAFRGVLVVRGVEVMVVGHGPFLLSGWGG